MLATQVKRERVSKEKERQRERKKTQRQPKFVLASQFGFTQNDVDENEKLIVVMFQTKRVGDGGWLPQPGPQGPQQDWSGRPTGVDRILKL